MRKKVYEANKPPLNAVLGVFLQPFFDKKNEFDIEKYVKNLCHAVVKPDDKMDAAYEYDAETGKIEQVQGKTEEKSQTWAGATLTTS